MYNKLWFGSQWFRFHDYGIKHDEFRILRPFLYMVFHEWRNSVPDNNDTFKLVKPWNTYSTIYECLKYKILACCV